MEHLSSNTLETYMNTGVKALDPTKEWLEQKEIKSTLQKKKRYFFRFRHSKTKIERKPRLFSVLTLKQNRAVQPSHSTSRANQLTLISR